MLHMNDDDAEDWMITASEDLARLSKGLGDDVGDFEDV